MTNLKLYVTKQDYVEWAGPDWPSYEQYIIGITASKPEIQKEISEFTDRYVQQGIKFPIKTATACQSKWTWSTIYLNKLSTASCHRVDPTPFSLEEFDNFHNLPKKIADRKLMLEGKWPTGGCEYCKNIEDAGGFSDRMHNLDIRGLTPPELENNATATHVTPRIIEIFAQNTCNLSCVYCNSYLSSKIEQENAKYGTFNQDGVIIPVIDKSTSATTEYFERWIVWLEENIHNLVRLHLLGGETFLQHDLMNRVLDIIEKKPNSGLQFCVFSNLNVPDKYWNLYIDRIKDLQLRKHIQYFDLTASIDCWGPEQQYVRSGLNLDKFEQRFSWASEQGNWLRLNANQTVTAMTMRTMPELIKKIDQYSKNKHIGHYFQFYTGPHMFQHPQTYAYTHWAGVFDQIFEAMPTNTPEQQEAIPRMQGLQAQLQQHTHHNYADIKKLKIYFDELDRRRGTDWRSLFGELDIHE
jgi:organic radical activating enzyme